MAEVTDWKKLTIPLLKQELANRSLGVKGRKSDLVSRLEQSDHALGGGPGSAEVGNENGSHNTTEEDVSGDDHEMVVKEENNDEEEKEEGVEELEGDEEDMDDSLLEEGNMGELLLDEGTTEGSLLEEDGTEVSQLEEGNAGDSVHAEGLEEEKDESFEKKDAEQDVSSEMENTDEVDKDESVDREAEEGEQKEGQGEDKQTVGGDHKDESLDGDDVIDMDLDEKDEEQQETEEADEEGEKKKETLKRFDLATLYIPKVDEIHKDLQVSQKFRVLYIYPLRTEMMGDPAVMVHFQHASSMPCKFYPTDTPEGKVYEGYLILRFEYSEDALMAMKGLREVLPDSVNIHVRQPSQTHKDMLSAFNRSEPQGIEPWIKDNKNTKVVFVGNLPPTATETALKEIFTGATIIRIAREDDSSSKGYAIVGYENEKDAEHAAKEYMCAIIDNYVLAVLYLSQANNRPAVDKEFYVDRTKLLEELKKFEEEIGLTLGEKKKKLKVTPGQIKKESEIPQTKDSPALKKSAAAPQRKGGKKEPATQRVKKDTPTSKASKETETNGEAAKESTEGSDGEKKPGERVRRSRWSNESERNRPQPQVMERLQRLQKKWERPPERQREQRRSGDTRPRRSWNSQRSPGDNKRQYPFRPDRDDKRRRMGHSPDSGRMTNYKPRMQSSLDSVYQQGSGMAVGGGPAMGGGMAQAGGIGMAVGMGMVGGMGGGMAQGGGVMMGGGMGGMVGQAGGMVIGGGMNAVPSLMSAGQMGHAGVRQPMMQSNVMGAGVGGGMGRGPGVRGAGGVAPSSGTVNLLLGLTQILSKQLSTQPQVQRRERSRPRTHSDTRR